MNPARRLAPCGEHANLWTSATWRRAGGRTVRLRSDKGVILKLRGTGFGYAASADVSRVTISLR